MYNELVNQFGGDFSITMKIADLKIFAEEVAEQAIEKYKNVINESENEVYYTTQQVLDMLQCDNSTLYRYTKKRMILPYKLGRENRYKRSDVIELIEGGKV